MGTHTLTIDGWRPVSLNRLLRAHWARRRALKRLDRDLVALHALAQGVPRATGRRRVTLRLAYDPKSPGLIDLGFRVCRDCELAGREEPTPPLGVIADAVRKADGLIGAALGLWRKGSEEWRQRKGGVG